MKVIFADHREVLDENIEGDIQKAVHGRLVRVRGIVQMYRGRPQIVISSPDQIEILD